MRTVFLIAATLAVAVRGQDREAPGQDRSLDSLLEAPIDARDRATLVNAASRSAQLSTFAPASVTVVTSDDIARFGYRTLADVLAAARDFYISYDRNYTYIGVRGFGRPTDYNNRILLLVDGHRLNDNIYGSALAGSELALPMEAVERIEIVRGPGSALYGTNAMFAVVNIVTKPGRAHEGATATMRSLGWDGFEVSLVAGRAVNRDAEGSISGYAGRRNGRDLYFQEYDSPETNGGIARDLDWERYAGVHGSAAFGIFTLAGNASVREKGIPTGAYDVLFNDTRTSTRDAYAYLEGTAQPALTHDLRLFLRASYDRYRYHGDYAYDIPQTEGSLGAWWSAEAQLHFDASERNRLIAGVEFVDNTVVNFWLRDTESTFFDLNKPYTLVSAYLHDEHQATDNLAFTLGLRVDRYSTVGTTVTPRCGLVYVPTGETALKVLVGQAYRAPNAYELYYEDPSSDQIANPGLRSEKILTIEGVWEQKFGTALSASLSVYHNTVDGIIETVVDPVDSITQFRNADDIHATGAGLGSRLRLPGGLAGYFSYSIQFSRSSVDGNALSNSPNHLLKLGCAVPVSPFGTIAGALRYESARRTVYDTRTRPFVLADAHVRTHTLFDHFTLTMSVRNLFNTTYGYPGGYEHAEPVIVQDGRSFEFGLTFVL